MLVRITIPNSQRITTAQLQELSTFLGEEVDHAPLITYKDDEGRHKYDLFFSYYHTKDPNDPKIQEKNLRFVTESDMVQLSDSKEYIADLTSLMQQFPHIKVYVRNMIQSTNITNKQFEVLDQMTAIQSKLETALKSFDEKIEFNSKCDVHVSNLGLLHINQLGYITDACTEALQENLNQGWRIIACCVQPDQRRPDYILGRFNPNETNVDVVKF